MDGSDGYEMGNRAQGNGRTVGAPPPNTSVPHAERRSRTYIKLTISWLKHKKPRWKTVLIALAFIGLFALLIWGLYQLPGLEAHKQIERDQPSGMLLQPTVETFSKTISAVSGFYMIPATTVEAGWLQVDQHQFESVSSPSPRGSTEPKVIGRKDEITFSRWGVEILYKLHRRAVSALQIHRSWCMHNVCSTSKVLSAMCKKKPMAMNRFEKQECDWCWGGRKGAELTTKQRDDIVRHCDTASHHAAVLLMIVCLILLVSAVAIAIMLVTRRLKSKRKAETDFDRASATPATSTKSWKYLPFQSILDQPKPSENAKSSKHQTNKVPWHLSLFKKPSHSLETHGNGERSRNRLSKKQPSHLDGICHTQEEPTIPIMPPARESLAFPIAENKGQGSFPDPKNLNSRRGSANRSRRLGACSSGSERNPLTDGIAMTRRTRKDERGLAEAERATVS